MKVLHLTLKKQWFDMIASGEKKEEYREVKEYWIKRICVNYRELSVLLSGKKVACQFPVIRFKNGYSANVPEMDIECTGIRVGTGNPKWGGQDKQQQFIIELGKILSIRNYNQ